VARIPITIEIESEPCEEGVRLKIGGRVDKSTNPRFEAALREAEESDAKQILLDLSDVVLMNYAGLRVLYEAHKRQRDDDERLRVVATSLQVRNLFAMSGVYDRFMGGRASAT
jgi:anti-anti-sigma factor